MMSRCKTVPEEMLFKKRSRLIMLTLKSKTMLKLRCPFKRQSCRDSSQQARKKGEVSIYLN